MKGWPQKSWPKLPHSRPHLHNITLGAFPHCSSGWGESWGSISFLTLEVMEAGGVAGALLAKPLLPEEVQLCRLALSMAQIIP